MKKLVLSIIILLLGLPAIGLAAPGDKVNVAESFEATVLTEELAARGNDMGTRQYALGYRARRL